MVAWNGFIWSEQGQAARSCKHGDELGICKIPGFFVLKLRNYWLLKRDFYPWSQLLSDDAFMMFPHTRLQISSFIVSKTFAVTLQNYRIITMLQFYVLKTTLQKELISILKYLISILSIKANEMCNFSNLFGKLLYMFRTGPLSITRSISTLYKLSS